VNPAGSSTEAVSYQKFITGYGKEAEQSLQKDVIRLVYAGRADTAVFTPGGNKQVSIRVCEVIPVAIAHRKKYAAFGQDRASASE
jgi:hypothetical protein